MEFLLPGDEGVVDGCRICLCPELVDGCASVGVGVFMWVGWGVSRLSPS
jgi:hypothetical protein